MKMSETKDFGKVSHRYTHRSKESRILAQAIVDAEQKLQMVIDSIDQEEVEKFYKVVTGNAYCRAFGAVTSFLPIEGTKQKAVVFNDAYVPAFITGNIRSISAADLGYDPNAPKEPLETVELNEWQVKRGYCYHFARVNLIAAVDNLQKRKFSGAMGHLCQALMQIGAASARDPAEIEKLSESRRGKEGGDKANAAYNHGRAKAYRWCQDNLAAYVFKNDLDGAARKMADDKVVSVGWRTIRGYITDYRKLTDAEVRSFITKFEITE